MKRSILVLGVVAALALMALPGSASAQGGAAPAAQAPPPPPPPTVKVGEPMPDFTLSYLEPAGSNPKPTPRTQKLSDLKGNVVVLAFFPAAFSPG
jgi:hypothetical protein